VEWHGDVLYRYALARLRNPTAAEEVVQETLLAALQARERFSGRSSEQTWLVGILKHTILDQFRRASRERPLESEEEWPADLRGAFTDGGGWQPSAAPAEWRTDARAAAQRQEFRDALAACLGRLPGRLADAFALRELEGLGAEDIRKVPGVSATNLWVMLHRERFALRRCLEAHGLGGSG
jgi:RNA polymerase sigma-70 factor (ECF subfamily)